MNKSVYIRTFGCQMNVKDSERVLGLLAREGYKEAATPEEAGVLLVNTCSVREKPEQKVLGVLGRWKPLKEKDPDLVIGVMGCVAQQKGREWLDSIPHLDLVMGTQMVHRVAELVGRAGEGERIALADWLDDDPDVFKVAPGAGRPGVTAFVSIMQGCDNFCAYCIVPFVRGKPVCRPKADVIGEVESLARAGVREVTLLGQNVNSYRDGSLDFPGLLELAAAAPGIERVRFTTSHPKDLDDGLIETMAKNPRIMENFHLPVQAGGERVLKRMNRGYTRERYLVLVEKLRAAMPEIGITTDLIVGFPGETEADFEDTLTLLREVRYDETFSFRYSIRPGTAAASFEDQVPEEEKYDRLYRLQELQRRITEEKNEAQVGVVHEVLIEGPSKTDHNNYSGRGRTNRLVHFDPAGHVEGDIVRARISRALKHSLAGDVVPVAAGRGPRGRREDKCLSK